MKRQKQVALLGCGALGTIIAEQLQLRLKESYMLSGILGRTPEQTQRAAMRFGCRNYLNLAELLADHPDYVAEAATGDAVRQYGPDILEHGIHLILLSSGALADDTLRQKLETAALHGGVQIWIVSGAIGGFDLMRTMELMGPLSTRVDSVKAPEALRDAPYMDGRSLGNGPCRVFDGPVREAIAGFPKNVNVAVAAALATAGADQTCARIDCHPGLVENIHRIEVSSPTVTVKMEISSRPEPANPRSSSLAAWSVIALLRELVSPIRFF